ncbi:MAG: HAD hydrolase-like protein [bacterium]
MKKNKIKLLIFDGYGVVMASGYPNTCREVSKITGVSAKKIFEVMYKKYFNMAALRKISQVEAWQMTINELKLPITRQKLAKLHMDLLTVRPRDLKFVRSLRKKYPTLLLSKNTRSQFTDTKKKNPIVWKSFDYIINTWELGLPKASRKTINFIAKRFKIKPSEMLYVDDQEGNLVEAKKMGVTTILYKNHSQFKRDVLKALK